MSDELHHLAQAYALDALDDVERVAFEAHYPTCDICSADVRAGRAVAARLAERTTTAPPDRLRDSIMAEIASTRQLSPLEPGRPTAPDELDARRQRRGAARWLAAAAASIVLVVVGVAVAVRTAGDETPGIDDVVASADASFTDLEGDGDGVVRVVWSPSLAQVAVIGGDLAAPGEGLVYELWSLTAAGAAVPAGLFTPDDDGDVRAVLDLDGAAGVTAAWGVTIEPDGGSAQPTSDVLFVGEV